MDRVKILYISGSIGLGHITRDIAIANALRRRNPNIEILWLASHPANLVLRDSGEKLVPEAGSYLSDNIAVDKAAREGRLNLVTYAVNVARIWLNHVKVYGKLTSQKHFDIIIGDETYELGIAKLFRPSLRRRRFVIIYDFVGLDSMSRNPFEKLAVYFLNFIWSRIGKQIHELALFVGEEYDVHDKRFGLLLPNRLHYARKNFEFVGYILPFNPSDYLDRDKVRAKLGYGREPLVICSVGGTSVGKELLELCAEAFPLVRKKSVVVSPEIEVNEYMPNLYEHFAASDLAIVQGGGTSTLELTALRRPFIFFPREGDCEQTLHVAERLRRHKAGIEMHYSKSTPKALSDNIIAHIGKDQKSV
jgi:UDP-N-acetylglucosamine:LPS N-acetylglucosamine transferase